MGKSRNGSSLPWPQLGCLQAAGTGCPVHSHHPLLPQDFESNKKLKRKVIAFLEEVMRDPELLTQERKAAGNIVRWGRSCCRRPPRLTPVGPAVLTAAPSCPLHDLEQTVGAVKS